ncbi:MULTISPECIES: DUF402 domain-containing protein [Terrabacteria group]|uniref:DUF402 domain-containing protein n=1 Tax=Bacillati TaxID=1783272 RepID=UPI001939C2FC|nr:MULTISPECIES: DUF402 domain-containing protein [Terrabacteria group]MBW9212805.1 DUF402 domain-containing protein [Trueperella sp. zg.1013]QRG86960.1 DUF402 domain-containing protein [Bulleidia sp. zg-1006]
MNPKVKDTVYVQSFKHDGSLHRTWCKAFVLEADEEKIVAVTDRAWVIESDGRKWITREPAVCFFYKKKWFNVISMIRHSGIYYYCNLASPSLYDGEAIKNVDYDLDVKLFPDRSYVILDEDEYREHGEEYVYSDDLKEVVEKSMTSLIGMMEREEEPFQKECINKYYQLYLNLKKEF